MTLPNLITIARILLVPFIVWLILIGRAHAAFWVFVLAGISDAVDGVLARQFNLRSDLGAYLDPIADKTLLVSIYVTLAVTGEVPVWVTILIVSRDVLIVGGVVLSWMLGEPTTMQPRRISKINTTAQIIFAAVVLGDLAFSLDLTLVRLVLMYHGRRRSRSARPRSIWSTGSATWAPALRRRPQRCHRHRSGNGADTTARTGTRSRERSSGVVA